MTPEDPLDDVATADTVSIAVAGKHVSLVPTRLSIRSFVGGRFPRHRADDLDREFAEFPELAATREYS